MKIIMLDSKFNTIPTYAQALDAYLAFLTKHLADYYVAQGFDRLTPVTFSVEPGRSFDKIVRQDEQRSVHSFVAKVDGNSKAVGPRKQGDIMKAAGWKAPAKHPRGSIFGNVADAISHSGHVHYL